MSCWHRINEAEHRLFWVTFYFRPIKILAVFTVSGWQHAQNYISTHWADWIWMDRRTKISRISSWKIWQPYGQNPCIRWYLTIVPFMQTLPPVKLLVSNFFHDHGPTIIAKAWTMYWSRQSIGRHSLWQICFRCIANVSLCIVFDADHGHRLFFFFFLGEGRTPSLPAPFRARPPNAFWRILGLNLRLFEYPMQLCFF